MANNPSSYIQYADSPICGFGTLHWLYAAGRLPYHTHIFAVGSYISPDSLFKNNTHDLIDLGKIYLR